MNTPDQQIANLQELLKNIPDSDPKSISAIIQQMDNIRRREQKQNGGKKKSRRNQSRGKMNKRCNNNKNKSRKNNKNNKNNKKN